MNTKPFTLGEVLSITDGRLMCAMEGVYRILDWMTGDQLFTHQLPRAMRECQPVLRQQLPQVAAINLDGVDAQNWQQRLAELVAIHGDRFDVAPLPQGTHASIDPVSELAQMRPDLAVGVIAFNAEGSTVPGNAETPQ